MKKNNLLVTVNDLKVIEKLKKVGVTTFLFPLKDFSVGFETTYSIHEIKEENAYLFINRILPSDDIDKLKELLNNLPNNIIGIVFDDLGVYQIIKNLNIKKILYLNHLANNYISINYYLEYVDSVIISTDITKEEIKDILRYAKKPLVLYTFGYVPVMYSRRLLVSNYQKHFDLESKRNISVSDTIANNSFKVYENDYGTVFYTSKPLNATELKEEKNILYNLVNTTFLNNEETITLISAIIKDENTDISSTRGFLDKKTIYKLRGDDHE